jgi:hypothetical protein
LWAPPNTLCTPQKLCVPATPKKDFAAKGGKIFYKTPVKSDYSISFAQHIGISIW